MPDSTVGAIPAVGAPVSGRTPVAPGVSRTLDVLRGVAALAVVVQHARTYLFADLSFLGPQPLAVRAVYFASGFGHAAVMVFFVLSGFLVGGSALAAIETGRFSWRRYFLRRGTRLWVVLLPALALTAAWDRAGVLVSSHPQTLAAHASTNSLFGMPWTVEGHGIAALAGNALFLMTVLVPTFGSDGSLWSLANEFWYYVLFPLAATALLSWRGEGGRARRDSRRALVSIALFIVIAKLVGHDILCWGSIWLMGTVAARTPRLRISRMTGRVLSSGISVGLAVVLVRDRLLTNDIALSRDLIVGALFALLLYALRCVPHDERVVTSDGSRLTRPLVALAGFGYTLYLVHEPPLALLREWIIARPHHRWTPSLAHLAAGAAIVAAIVCYAWGVSRLTEARTDDVRAWLRRRLAAWHPSLAPAARAAHRLVEATEGIAPAGTWQTTADS